MNVNIYIEPIIEPVTVEELGFHLNLGLSTLAESVTTYTCTASGSHFVTTGYTLYGTGIDILGKKAIVNLQPANNGTGGTVDCKIQDSNDNTNWFDWTGGAFLQVTESNDTVPQEIEYIGSKRYLRTAAKTLIAACEFGTDVMVWAQNESDSDYLEELITNGRLAVENDTSKKIMDQTIDYFPKRWPDGDRIKIPFGNLTSIVSVAYKDLAGTTTTLTEHTDYLVEMNGTQCGFVVLPYQGSWPSSDPLYPSNPITIRFVTGWATQAEVPVSIKRAIKAYCVNLYANRGDDVIGQTVSRDTTYDRLVNIAGRLWDMDFL